MNKKTKNFIFTIMLLIIFMLGFYFYTYKKNILIDKITFNELELENIKIDEYNFEQLEKVKSILNGLDKDSYNFENLKEFNEKFNQNIKPIKNCYYLSSNNGTEKYLFGFQLHSDKYRKKHNGSYFAYPKYNLEEILFCDGKDCSQDMNFNIFSNTITYVCGD